MRRWRNYFPEFKDEGEMIAGWGEAQLIKYLDGRYELGGGTKADIRIRIAQHCVGEEQQDLANGHMQAVVVTKLEQGAETGLDQRGL